MKRSRTSILLIEIMISILFLSISIAVCVQLFVAAHLTGEESNDRNVAIFQSQTIADTFSAMDGNIDELAEQFALQQDGEIYLTYYDENGQFTRNENRYSIVITPSENGDLITLDMEFIVTDTDLSVYNLHTSVYRLGGHQYGKK